MADADSLENISEADQQLLKIGRDLAGDPKTRRAYLKLIKAKYPDQVIPELDNEAAMQAFAKPHTDKIAELEKKLMERDVKERISERRAALKAQGHGDDDIKAIEELMVKEQIPNHLTAAKHYSMSRQLSAPTPALSELTNKLPIDKKAIQEAGGIKQWGRTEAIKAFEDIRAGRVKIQH